MDNDKHIIPTHYLVNVVGDSGPTERKVSPDKLYRAAILKKRFVDTILKAREKLTQVSPSIYLKYMETYSLCTYPSDHCFNLYVICLNLAELRMRREILRNCAGIGKNWRWSNGKVVCVLL